MVTPNYIGRRIIWLNGQIVRAGVVTAQNGSVVWVNDQHRPEDCVYLMHCYLEENIVRVRSLLALKQAAIDAQKIADDGLMAFKVPLR